MSDVSVMAAYAAMTLTSLYNFNYFNNIWIFTIVCISWGIKCLILLMHGATMMYTLLKIWITQNAGKFDLLR